jgi:hypothetical protein
MNEAMTPAELASECRAILDLLPPNRWKIVNVGISPTFGLSVVVYPTGVANGNGEWCEGDTFAGAFSKARAFCLSYESNPEEHRREAQAEFGALNGGEMASLPVEVHHGVGG